MSAKPPPILPFAEDTAGLVAEYASFVKSIRVDSKKPAVVYVTTLENVDLEVEVSSAGWTINKIEGQKVASETKALKGESYEGAEALLMAVSIGFTKKWHKALIEKLFALGGTMEEDEEEEEKGTTT